MPKARKSPGEPSANDAGARLAAAKEQIDAQRAAMEEHIDELRAALTGWEAAEACIWEAAGHWAKFQELAGALDIEGILTAHVPLDRRWLLDRLLLLIREIDEDLEEATEMVPGEVEPFAEAESARIQ